jgi:hypothetical protein
VRGSKVRGSRVRRSTVRNGSMRVRRAMSVMTTPTPHTCLLRRLPRLVFLLPLRRLGARLPSAFFRRDRRRRRGQLGRRGARRVGTVAFVQRELTRELVHVQLRLGGLFLRHRRQLRQGFFGRGRSGRRGRRHRLVRDHRHDLTGEEMREM